MYCAEKTDNRFEGSGLGLLSCGSGSDSGGETCPERMFFGTDAVIDWVYCAVNIENRFAEASLGTTAVSSATLTSDGATEEGGAT